MITLAPDDNIASQMKIFRDEREGKVMRETEIKTEREIKGKKASVESILYSVQMFS